MHHEHSSGFSSSDAHAFKPSVPFGHGTGPFGLELPTGCRLRPPTVAHTGDRQINPGGTTIWLVYSGLWRCVGSTASILTGLRVEQGAFTSPRAVKRTPFSRSPSLRVGLTAHDCQSSSTVPIVRWYGGVCNPWKIRWYTRNQPKYGTLQNSKYGTLQKRDA